MHYYQFNIGDYTSHTRGLTLLEDLAYRRLLDEYYLAEQPFNMCSTDVARIIGFVEHEKEVEYVLQRFFKFIDGGWHHERIENEIAEYKTKQEKRSKAGKASAESRANHEDSTPVEQTLNTCSTNVELTNNHKPITNISITPPGFDEFFDEYGKRKAKANAIREWKKLKLSPSDIEKLMGGVRSYVAKNPDPQYRKDPERWLKARMWEDEDGETSSIFAGAMGYGN